jgi:hypothetical protein
MAELTPTASSCCSPADQVICCEPEEKDGCCTPASSDCGCSAREQGDGGDASAPGPREVRRESSVG